MAKLIFFSVAEFERETNWEFPEIFSTRFPKRQSTCTGKTPRTNNCFENSKLSLILFSFDLKIAGFSKKNIFKSCRKWFPRVERNVSIELFFLKVYDFLLWISEFDRKLSEYSRNFSTMAANTAFLVSSGMFLGKKVLEKNNCFVFFRL